MELETNVLYYGDNLDILRNHIPDESIDLIYLDPPFNSNRSYNVLFRESTGAGSEAQLEAFEDTWHWGPAAQATYEELANGPQVAMRLLKRSVYNAAEQTFAHALDDIAAKTAVSDHHPDAREGATAFREKRMPRFNQWLEEQ